MSIDKKADKNSDKPSDKIVERPSPRPGKPAADPERARAAERAKALEAADRKSTCLNSSHVSEFRMPSSA